MPFDLFCLGLALLLALFGLFRGLVRQIFGLVGFLGGIVLARLFSQPFGDAFAQDLHLPVTIAVAACALVLFIAAEVAAKLSGNFLHGHLGSITGTLDKLGGLAVGAAKGLLVAWALASLVVLVRPHLRSVERDTPAAGLDLAHSQAVQFATSTNLIAELRDNGPSDAERLRRKVDAARH